MHEFLDDWNLPCIFSAFDRQDEYGKYDYWVNEIMIRKFLASE